MAVFWFGWAKKLKNIFTKQQADQYYLQKNSNQLQQVSGFVDFTSNVVCKRNGYVDNVDTNAPTSMINKRYLDNARAYIAVFSNTSTVYNNLDKIPLTNPTNFTAIERNIPWIIKFDRIVKSSGAYEGTVNFSFILPDNGKATFATSRMYYVASSGNFEEGPRVGISIKVVGTRSYDLKIQIWDQTKAIKNITLYKPQL